MKMQSLRHIAIIMDGNGRWAQGRGLARLDGHHRGAAAVRKTITHCRDAGLHFLTLYAFSTENWARPAFEVNGLMELLTEFLVEQEDRLKEHGIELAAIGDLGKLPNHARSLLERVMNTTRGLGGMRLTLALSYSGRDEIVRAARRLAGRVARGELLPEAIDDKLFADNLDTQETPAADLVIRTGSERRLSNFLLWQSAYAELFFTDQRWPDFGPEDLDRAVAWYHARKRTFGLVEATG